MSIIKIMGKFISLSLICILVLFQVAFVLSQKTSASSTFSASWDNGSFNADSGQDGLAGYTDGSFPDFVSPGYGDSGEAIKFGLGDTLKYNISNNLNPNKGQVEFKFKSPYALSGDSMAGKFSGPQGIFYDPATGYVYVADTANNRIVKTKMDGTDWTSYGNYGASDAGAGRFYGPTGIFYDSATGYIYIEDLFKNRSVKTKIYGTGCGTYG